MALLTVELGLLAAARSRHDRIGTWAWTGFFLVPLTAALALRTFIAVSAHDVLQWDETYYLSTAVTGGLGRGLYPFVFGYSPMPILGGLGHLAWLDVMAVKLAGPNIIALRVVSLAGAAASIALMYRLVRTLYGHAAGLMGAVITASMYLMFLTNSARMDALTFAFVTAGLLAVFRALARDTAGAHYLAGLIFGLALQAHLDATVTAVACGLPYLFKWRRDCRAAARLRVPTALLLYTAGFATGLAIFIICNVLPDPDAFYRTTAQVRVDATTWYSSGTTSLAGSFLNPSVLWAKETARYRLLYKALPFVEIAVFAAAILAAVVRRTSTDRDLLLIAAGAVLGAAILVNNESPLYFTHVAPALCVLLAPLFARGFSRQAPTEGAGLSGSRSVAFAVFVCALGAVNGARPAAAYWSPAPDVSTPDNELAQRVRALASPACTVAGDGRLYVRHFADYPNFISSGKTEVDYAMMFLKQDNEFQYWKLKQPDVVFGREFSPGLSLYMGASDLVEAAPGIWMAPSCRK
ncbi:MAG TPA: glycosyltransferase family 39 protein [Vicinamibacterales bacterium]|nr:glycosyltransferase family 39 protein [Vicinamibacterales bacterium]